MTTTEPKSHLYSSYTVKIKPDTFSDKKIKEMIFKSETTFKQMELNVSETKSKFIKTINGSMETTHESTGTLNKEFEKVYKSKPILGDLENFTFHKNSSEIVDNIELQNKMSYESAISLCDNYINNKEYYISNGHILKKSEVSFKTFIDKDLVESKIKNSIQISEFLQKEIIDNSSLSKIEDKSLQKEIVSQMYSNTQIMCEVTQNNNENETPENINSEDINN
jgi:hypothetical protein